MATLTNLDVQNNNTSTSSLSRNSYFKTDTWTPVASSVTFTASSKLSRGGFGHLGDIFNRPIQGNLNDGNVIQKTIGLDADVASQVPYSQKSTLTDSTVTRNSYFKTDTWSPISSGVTYTSGAKTARGGYGHFADLFYRPIQGNVNSGGFLRKTGTIKSTGYTTVTTTQTQTGVARIQVTTTKTLTGVARIGFLSNKTQTGVARITSVTSQPQTGVARITNSTTKTQSGVSRIQISTSQTQTGVANIVSVLSQMQTGVARITAITTKTQTGVSRIQITATQTQSGVANIVVAIVQTQTGVARITVSTAQTQSGVSRITAATIQTQSGVS